MKDWFDKFLKEKRYLGNCAHNTILYYERCFIAWTQTMGDQEATKSSVNEFVVKMREAGKSPACCDAYVRGFNVFLSWLYESELIRHRLVIKRLKLEKRVLKTFTDAQVSAIINYKPKDKFEKRLHVLLLLLLDTGIRINEALTLERSNVDFDNLLLTVSGKGNKQRIVPFSIELRKHLYRFMSGGKAELVFANSHGGKLLYDNMRRDFNKLLVRLGIEVDGSFHAFRRCFATNYIRENGNPLKLQRVLGHTTLRQTNDYVKLITEDLQRESQKTSILNRLR